MAKISVTIDVKKIDKNKLVERVYTNKEGVEVKELNLRFDLVELDQQINLAEGDTWVLRKTHFAATQLSKDEKAAGEKSVVLGMGASFDNKEAPKKEEEIPAPTQSLDEAFPDSEIPF